MNSTIRAWLETLGLAQYASAFEDNDIDMDLLGQVDDQMLKDIGVSSAGHRLRLRSAIQKLATSPTVEATPTQSSPSTTAERRQLTILFCDLVGSTQLAQRLDPERLREVMQAYQQGCREVIEKYEGHVAQYLGDGLMVYFGWPRAHEDDAERAARAALEIVQAITGLHGEGKVATPLQVRLGIATGPVVVGETGAGDASVPKLAVGETPNLASRLQGLAAPNQIIIGPTNHRLLGNTFTLDDLGAHTLKGITYPVQAYAVTGLNIKEGRFDAARGHAQLSAMVGREDELSVVIRRWEQAREGEGHVVLLCGEAGIGKSRILRAVQERIGQAPHGVLRHQCSTFHINSTLYPFIAPIQALFGREESAEQKLDRLEAWLSEAALTDATSAALLAGLLSLPTARYPALQLTPQRQKERTLSLFVERIANLSARQPLLVLFEDAHWADPTSLELLDLMVRRVDSQRVMFLITYRPEFTPAWIGQAQATLLTLSRLSKREAEALVMRVTKGKRLPLEVMTQILAKTDGVPLFVEELTKAVLESHLLQEEDEAYTLEGPLPPLAIPSTLQDSLMARLDRLAGAKEVAQMGACIGREFGFELLWQVSQLNKQTLEAALKQLTDAEILFKRGDAEHAIYTFKHALIQDAAYDSLLKSRRVQIHQRIALTLEEKFPEIVNSQPEVPAQHYASGEVRVKAVSLWHKAGEMAIGRFAPREAIAHLNKGMELLKHIEPSIQRDRQELALRGALALAWNHYGGWAHPMVAEVLRGTQDLAKLVGQMDRSVFRVWAALGLSECCSGRIRHSLGVVEELHQLSTYSGDEGMQLAARGYLGCIYYWSGEFTNVLKHSEFMHAQESIAQSEHTRALWGGGDVTVEADMFRFLALFVLGYPDRALSLSMQCIDRARRAAHVLGLIGTLMHCGLLHGGRSEAGLMEERFDEVEALARRHDLVFAHDVWLSLPRLSKYVVGGNFAEALKQYPSAISKYKASGNLIGMPVTLAMYATAAIQCDDPNLALNLTDEALEQIYRPGWEERGHLAEVLRVRGLALAALGREDEAEVNFNEAIQVARQQNAKSWELRAATDFAEFWKVRGMSRQAFNLLHPVYDWFTEGFATHDLIKARTLLESLR